MPSLLSPDDVGGSVAWRALCRDGALVPVWRTLARRATMPAGPALRARALASVLRPGLVIGGTSAAWVYCGGPAPDVVTALHRARTHRPWLDGAVRVGQASLLASDVVELDGVLVTAVQRTGLDVARDEESETALAWLARLGAVGFELRTARLALERRPRWHRRPRIRATLDAYELALTGAAAGGGGSQTGSCGVVAARAPVIR